MIEKNPKKRVVVTGAGGFVGNHLVAALLKAGHEVTAIVRRRLLPSSLNQAGLKVVQGDITDPGVQQECLKQTDAVCHLAAFIPANYEDPSYAAECLRTNGLLTLQLAQIAVKNKIRFINFSTAAVYRYSDQPVDEGSVLYPSQKAVYYATSKLAGELYVEHLRAGHGLQAVTFRVGSCYGFGMPDKSVVAYFMKSTQQGLPLNVSNGGIARYDYVHVSDLIGVTLAALNSGQCGVYNVGTGTAHTVCALAKFIAELFVERKGKINVNPVVDPSLQGLPALSIKKAKKMWDYNPLTLQEGLVLYRQNLDESLATKGSALAH